MPQPAVTAAALPEPALAKNPRQAPLKTSHTLLFLLVLTALGAFLRFWRLGFQSYWTDEGYTIAKIRGTFTQMLDSLTDQGFPPGWYAMLRAWCLALENHTHNGAYAFSPAATRLLPAFFGALTVPVMYFLGRQFTDRRGALLVTLLAAVNPFLIYYSRDIKMYAALWFFATLNMAIFFQWQTSHRHWLWFIPFALTGFCMTAIQSVAWFLVGLQFVFLLTKPRPKSMDAPLWLAGVAAMALFPLYWFYQYVEPAKWIARVSGDTNAGTVWYLDYTDMSWKTLAGLPTSHLLGYLWPVYPPDQKIIGWFALGDDFKSHLATRSFEWLARWEWYVALALFAILLLGLIPWRGRRWRREIDRERQNSSTRGRWWWIALWIFVPSAILAATWIPTQAEYQQRLAVRMRDRDRAAATVELLRSRQTQQSPTDADAARALADQLAAAQAQLAPIDADIASLKNAVAANWFGRIWRGVNVKSIWEPRYLGILLPAWILWLAASLRRLPTWPVRALAITFVTAVSLISALTNHLIYRNVPYQHAADIAERYFDPKAGDRSIEAVAVPTSYYPAPAENVALTVARNVRPGTPADLQYVAMSEVRTGSRGALALWRTIASPNAARAFLTNASNQPRVKTIVLTDQYGDLTSPDQDLSDAALSRVLGPRWKLVHTESYPLYYEWRFYIFHTWRTRVWQLQLPQPASAPASASRPNAR